MPRGGTAPACDEKPWGGGLGTSYNIYDSIKIYGTSAANQNINAYSKWKPQTDLIQPKPRKKAPLSLGEGFGRCSVGSPADKGQRNSSAQVSKFQGAKVHEDQSKNLPNQHNYGLARKRARQVLQ